MKLNSPRLLQLKKHRRRVVLNKIFLSLVALATVFASLAYLSRLKQVNISEIEISGNTGIETETIKATIEKEISGDYLWFFPKTNIFFYPKNKIKNDLSAQFKRLQNINLSIKNYKTLEVSVAERTALYTWCGNEFPPLLDKGRVGEGSEKCYFVDENGYIFDEAPYFSGEVYFKFYGPQTESFFAKKNFKQLISFKDTLTAIRLKPVSLYIGDDGEVTIALSAKTLPTGPKILFKIDSDFQKIAENLQAALSTEPLLSNFKNKYASLEYIDLRYGNKVYYKFR